MCAQVNANLQSVKTQEGFDPLPPGWYPARIIDSEIKEGPKGSYIRWTFEVIGFPNRVWDQMSLGNDVSMQRLKTLATCAGHRNPNFIADTEELHGLTCMVRLKIQKDEGYDPKNQISAFKPIGDTAPAAPAATVNQAQPPAAAAQPAVKAPPATPPAQAAKPKMPWEK